jgi:hypothetical protein
LSHEEPAAEDESIAYESINLIHKVLKKEKSMLLNLKYKLIFSNLIDHFKTHDISLLNKVIQVFKQLKAILGEVEYSNHLHRYLEMQDHTYMREIIDIYTIIFDDSPKLPHEFDFEQSIRLL